MPRPTPRRVSVKGSGAKLREPDAVGVEDLDREFADACDLGILHGGGVEEVGVEVGVEP